MTYAYAICAEKDIPNRKCKAFSLLRVEEDGSERPWHILVVRWDKQVFGYVNRCPHEGVNLDWERNQFFDGTGKRLICGKHGSVFEVRTGKCVEGRCQGQSLEPVSVSIVDGDICVTGVTLAEEE
jgi:nitrite reductase/ring-hydroxylating ferredoxin subunit